MAWLRANLSSASAARLAFSPVADILAAMSPATSGVENDVPLHLAMLLNLRRWPLSGASLHTYRPLANAFTSCSPGAYTSTQPP